MKVWDWGGWDGYGIKVSTGCMYTVWHPLSRDVLFCYLSEVPVTNWAAQWLQYQLNGRWNMTKMLSKISQLNGSPTVYIPVSHANPVAVLLVNTGVGVGG